MKNFLIYRSSAGSGKTYSLVKEYLKLVLKDPENLRHTLAITFTNKAAAEMKSRIVASLIALANNNAENLKKNLEDEGVKTDIAVSASAVLSKILHNYSYFSVSTIDSFFQKVIRAFAKELKLTLGYNVQLDTDTVLDKVVDDVFKDIGEDKDITRYLTDFAFQNIDEDRGWHIDKNIKFLASEIFRERYWERKLKSGSDIIDDKARIREFVAVINKFRYSFEARLIGIAQNAQEIMKKHGLRADDFKYKGNGVGWYFRKMSSKESYNILNKLAPNGYCRNTLSGKDDWCLKDSLKRDAMKAAVEDGLRTCLEDMVNFTDANVRKYITIRILQRTLYTVGIFSDVIKKVNEWRDDNHAILISDSNTLLKSVISEQPAPFVYEKIGDFYKHFLIDEFQDTSGFQWHNLLPLIINSLSEDNFSAIVGDAKQSIYRWRNGNMMLLLREAEQDLSIFKDNIQSIPLNKNYRSKPNIIKFNNNLFPRLADAAAASAEIGDASIISLSYKDVTQTPALDGAGGFVRIEFIDSEKDSPESAAEKAGLKMVGIVKSLLSEGIRPSDILILTRLKEELRQASQLLNCEGIQVVSDESLLLRSSPKVRLLASVLKYISGRKNKFTKSEVLYNWQLCQGEKSASADKMFGYANEEFEAEILPKLDPRKMHKGSLYELTEYLVRAFGLDTQADLYLTGFLDVILDYVSSQNLDLSSFVEWWEENNRRFCIVATEQNDSVRLMTIHTAKGLERKIVIIPFAHWDLNLQGNRDHIWVSSDEEPFNRSSAYLVKALKDLAESYFDKDFAEEYILTYLDNLNLLYVAFTRAKERLYVISPEKQNSQKTVNGLLKTVMQQDLWFSSLAAAENIYQLGEEEKISSGLERVRDANIRSSSIVSCDFRERTVIRPLHEKLSLGRAESYAASRNRGILLHRALSYINSAADIDKAIAMVKLQGLMDESFEPGLREELQQIIKTKQAAPWFNEGNEVRSELELLTKDPEKPAIRPDRVIISDDKIVLIDYKTGAENAEHKNQIKAYAGILKDAGYSNIEAYLMYLENRKVVQVI